MADTFDVPQFHTEFTRVAARAKSRYGWSRPIGAVGAALLITATVGVVQRIHHEERPNSSLVNPHLTASLTMSPSADWMGYVQSKGTKDAPKQPSVTNIVHEAVSYPNDEKTALQTKMVNAIDYYSTVEGSFYENFSPIHQKRIIDFKLDLPNQKAVVHINTNGHTEVFTQDGNSGQEGTLPPMNRAPQDFDKDKTTLHSLSSRYLLINGKPGYVLRPSPIMSNVQDDVVFPQTFALGFLKDHSKWNIDGKTTYLGRSATVISGQMPSDLEQKHDAVRFVAVVDNETGILLKEQEFSSAGQVTNEIVVTSLSVNQPVDIPASK